MKKLFSKRMIALVLSALMLVSLTGCKESLAFQQIEYSQDMDEVTDDDQLVDNEEEYEEEDEDIFSQDERDDAETERHYDESEAVSGDSSGTGSGASYSSSASDSGESDVTEDDADDGSDGSSTSEADDTGYEGDADTDANPNEEGSGNASDEGEADAGSQDGESQDENNDGVSTEDNDDDSSLYLGDTSGSVYEDSTSTNTQAANLSQDDITAQGAVIATGEATILVQMLSGGEAGYLYATDAATLSVMRSYFGDNLSGVAELWDSSGNLNTTVLSQLQATGNCPSACLMDASTASEEDVNTLTAAGITCWGLSFSSYDDMISSAAKAAAALGTDTAAQMQASYTSFCENIVSAVSGYSSSKYTLYVSSWDSAAQLTISTSGGTWSSQYGIGVGSNLSSAAAPSMWSLAGIYNNYSTNNYRGGSYIHNTQVYRYSNYYLCQFWLVPYLSGTTLANGSYYIEKGSNALVYGLGSDSYPALIASSQSVKASIEADRDSGNGMLSLYPQSGSKYNLTIGTKLVSAYVQGNFDVYVNPSGLGDWVNGSAESILEAIWAAWQIQGTCTQDQVYAAVKEFYETFYRCSLTDAQVSAILAGS